MCYVDHKSLLHPQVLIMMHIMEIILGFHRLLDLLILILIFIDLKKRLYFLNGTKWAALPCIYYGITLVFDANFNSAHIHCNFPICINFGSGGMRTTKNVLIKFLLLPKQLENTNDNYFINGNNLIDLYQVTCYDEEIQPPNFLNSPL